MYNYLTEMYNYLTIFSLCCLSALLRQSLVNVLITQGFITDPDDIKVYNGP